MEDRFIACLYVDGSTRIGYVMSITFDMNQELFSVKWMDESTQVICSEDSTIQELQVFTSNLEAVRWSLNVECDKDHRIPLDSCDHPDISCFECSFSHECTRYGIKDEEIVDPGFHCRNLGIMDCGSCNDCEPKDPAPFVEYVPQTNCGKGITCFECDGSDCEVPF